MPLLEQPNVDVQMVLSALRNLRVKNIGVEFEIQSQIAECLTKADIQYQKEYKLGSRSRIDFLVEGGIGIEVKKSRPNESALIAQAARYAGFDRVTAIIIVVQKQWRLDLPEQINGKPLHLISTNRLLGVAI